MCLRLKCRWTVGEICIFRRVKVLAIPLSFVISTRFRNCIAKTLKYFKMVIGSMVGVNRTSDKRDWGLMTRMVSGYASAVWRNVLV
jgi:disulfide bond formation protein DsbB